MTETNRQAEYRKLPAVDALLREPAITALAAEFGLAAVADGLRGLLAEARAAIAAGGAAPDAATWAARLADALARTQVATLRPVINATGVIVHTNLGRAPLSHAALDAVQAVAQGYSTLEYDLDEGARGSRHDHAKDLLAELTGAEDAVVVNNNAGAVYLTLSALCAGREVIISRGQLVEIGGGFRIPDVLRQSGATLVEVGATNRTHAHDFRAALGERTAALMRVHSSNFRQIGFVSEPALDDLAALAHGHRDASSAPVILIDDLGSGTLLDTRPYGLAAEPMVQQSLAAGADVVTFSGDKLLGGPQAGLIVGRRELLATIRRHPMARALRVDKMTLAALEATLRAYRRGRAPDEVPVWRMIAAPAAALQARALAWQRSLSEHMPSLSTEVVAGESAVGGGSLPGETLPTFLLAVRRADVTAAAARLRQADPPVIGRIQRDQLLFDPRTVLPEQDAAFLAALAVLAA